MHGLPLYLLLTSLALLALALLGQGYLSRRLQRQHQQLDGLLRQLERLGGQDPLTGLGNLHSLLQRLNGALASPRGGPFSLLVLQLEPRPGGAQDELIRRAALRLAGELRGDDYIARIAPLRFAILSGAASAELAEALLQRLMQSLQQPYRHRPGPPPHVSGAYSLAPEHGRQAHRLLQRTEQALPGGGRLPSPDAGHAMGHALREALEGNQLELRYQPIVLAAQTWPRALAVMPGWRPPQGGRLDGHDCHALAESFGQQDALQLALLRRLAAELPRLRQAWPQPWLGLDWPAALLAETEPWQALLELQRAHPGLRLRLYLTGTLFDEAVGERLQRLQQLRQLGVELFLDDLPGQGLPLQLLGELPLDGLRLDLARHPSGVQGLVGTCLALGHQLGWQLQLGGLVATPQRESLQAHGEVQLQGDLLCRPLALAALEDWLAERRGG